MEHAIELELHIICTGTIYLLNGKAVFLEALASAGLMGSGQEMGPVSTPKHQLWRIQVTANGLQHIPLDLSWAAKGSGATMASNEWWKFVTKMIHFEVKLDTVKLVNCKEHEQPCCLVRPLVPIHFPPDYPDVALICFGSFSLTQPFYNFLLLLHILPPFLQLCSLFFFQK